MTRPGEVRHRYRCLRCDTAVPAGNAEPGMVLRCPACGVRVAVIPRQRPEGENEAEGGYALRNERATPPRPASPPEEPAAPQPRRTKADEGFPLRDDAPLPRGAGGPPPKKPVPEVYIPVECRVCHTLMHPTASQSGKRILCPDCGVATVVPAYRPPRTPRRTPVIIDGSAEYAVREDWTPSQPKVIGSEAELTSLECFLCGTRLQVAHQRAGSKIGCPDCGSQLVVPVQKRKREVKFAADQGAYSLDGTPPPPPLRTARPGSRFTAPPRREEGAGHDDAETSREHDSRVGIVYERPDPPEHPFVEGILRFPLYQGVSYRLAVLSLWALVNLTLLALALAAAAVPSLFTWPVAMFYFGIVGALSLAWLFFAAAIGMAILSDTAAGNDRIESWKDGPFLDNLGDGFYVLNAAAVAALPFYFLARFGGPINLDFWWFVPLAMFFFFPLVLLSMFDNRSALLPLASQVIAGLFRAPGAWLAFYLESALLAAAAIGIVGLAWLLALPLAVLVAAVVIPTAWLMYFRLLGRLGWCCAAAVPEGSASAPSGSADDGKAAAAPPGRPGALP